MTDTMILFAASLAFALGALLLASAGLRRSAITGGRNRSLERQLADQGAGRQPRGAVPPGARHRRAGADGLTSLPWHGAGPAIALV